MHPNTNRALMYVQANQLVDLLVTIEPQYRMMISLGYEVYLNFIYSCQNQISSASSDGDAACLAIIDDIESKVPRSIATGFGLGARHITFENALTKIGHKLGRDFLIHIFYLLFVLFSRI
jgi:hypothetical protein